MMKKDVKSKLWPRKLMAVVAGKWQKFLIMKIQVNRLLSPSYTAFTLSVVLQPGL